MSIPNAQLPIPKVPLLGVGIWELIDLQRWTVSFRHFIVPLAPGTQLGPYEIDSPLGAGGMGEVYKARDTRLNRTVAIKVLPEHVATDPTLKQRFELEAKAVSSLNHPHICTLYDVGHHPSTGSGQGVDFLVLEYLDGETLAQRIERARLDVAQALAIAIQVASALDQAHRAGVVHRDLKPANILLLRKASPSGQPLAKLLDFGLAKSSAPVVTGSSLSMLPTTPAGVTVQGSILGTLQYMAPEQIEGIEADPRTDLFALGTLLFEMLTGRTAFEGKTSASLLGAILKDQPPAVSALRPDAPAALDRIVATCLAKERDDRWQTARDLLRELQWVADRPRDQSVPVPLARAPRRRAVVWAAVGIGILAYVALAIPAFRYWRVAGTEGSPVRLELTTPATTDSVSFALSPDGTQIAFVGSADGRTRLWVRALDSSQSRALDRTDGASNPFWSPDSRSIAFFAEQKLKRIDVATGSVQSLADVRGGNGGSWGPDETILFTSGPARGIERVSANGGAPTRVTTVEPDHQGHRHPQFLPDGRHFLYYVRGADDVRGIYVSSLDGLTPRRVLDGDTAAPVFAVDRQIFYVRQSTLFAHGFDPIALNVTGAPRPLAEQVGVSAAARAALTASSDGIVAYRTSAIDSRRQYVWIDRSGKPLGTLGPPDDNRSYSPQLSPDGTQVVMHRSLGGNADIYILDAQRATMTRVTTDPANEITAVWSPDGKRLAFSGFRAGAFSIRLRTLADGKETELPINGTVADWSPDGRLLLYGDSTGNARVGLHAVSIDDAKSVLVAKGASGRGQFAPDGRWIAFESTESGQMEIYVQAFPTSSGKVRVSTNGGAQPRWSRDGRELFYVGLDDRLMSVPIRAGASGALAADPPVPLFPTQVGGAIQELTSASYMVSSDGQRFLMNSLLEEAHTEPIRFILTRQRH